MRAHSVARTQRSYDAHVWVCNGRGCNVRARARRGTNMASHDHIYAYSVTTNGSKPIPSSSGLLDARKTCIGALVYVRHHILVNSWWSDAPWLTLVTLVDAHGVVFPYVDTGTVWVSGCSDRGQGPLSQYEGGPSHVLQRSGIHQRNHR